MYVRARSLPSALSAAEAQKAKENIEKGFEKKLPSPRPPATQAAAHLQPQSKAEQRARAKDIAASSALYSSDSEGGGVDENELEKEAGPATDVQPVPKAAHEEATESPIKETTPQAIAGDQETPTAPIIESLLPRTLPSSQTQIAVQTQLKPKRQPGMSETKRPLPRASRIPDLSFFPSEVGLICKRIAAYITRSVILDEDDYDAFIQQYDKFRQDWETLDKVRVSTPPPSSLWFVKMG